MIESEAYRMVEPGDAEVSGYFVLAGVVLEGGQAAYVHRGHASS